MATSILIPHTRIDNSIIDNCACQIGIYGLGIYVAIKRHLNQKTGDCYPSYKTIARKLGIDRGTVIRYVKKLKALNLLSPTLRFKEDGSHTSNQYSFDLSEGRQDKGSGTEQSEVVVKDNQPGGRELPEQSEGNKKERTISDVDYLKPPGNLPRDSQSAPVSSHIFPSENQKSLQPTEKQKACPHPPSGIVFLADSVTICHHCYGLLDENLTLRLEETPIESGETPPVEIVAA